MSDPIKAALAQVIAGRELGFDDARVRAPRLDDFDDVEPLHLAEFPDTYLTTRQMLADGVSGELIVAVSEAEDGRFLGYGSGRVQPEGSGYLDFIAITPDARGTGAGLGLLATICRWIIEAAPQRDVNLTVQHHRAPRVPYVEGQLSHGWPGRVRRCCLGLRTALQPPSGR